MLFGLWQLLLIYIIKTQRIIACHSPGSIWPSVLRFLVFFYFFSSWFIPWFLGCLFYFTGFRLVSLPSVSPCVCVILLCEFSCRGLCFILLCFPCLSSVSCLHSSLCFSVFPPVCISVYFLFYSEGLCLMLVYSVLLPCLVVPNQFHRACHLFLVPSCSCLCIYIVCHLVLVVGSSVFLPCLILCHLPASPCIPVSVQCFVCFSQYKFLCFCFSPAKFLFVSLTSLIKLTCIWSCLHLAS